MEEKQISTNELAEMVKRGFDNTASKEDLKGLETNLAGVETRLTQRIEILEHRVLNEHSTRIDILEDNIRQIKTKLEMA